MMFRAVVKESALSTTILVGGKFGHLDASRGGSCSAMKRDSKEPSGTSLRIVSMRFNLSSEMALLSLKEGAILIGRWMKVPESIAAQPHPYKS